MKFRKSFKPELFTYKDGDRPHLEHLHLDVEGKRLVATDGHRMVVVPVEIEPGDKSGPIPTRVLAAARHHELKQCETARVGAKRLHALGTGMDAKGPVFERPVLAEPGYPPYAKVVSDSLQPTGKTVTFGVNPQYLLDCAKALGCQHVQVTVTLPTAETKGKVMWALKVMATGEDETKGVCFVMPVLVRKKDESTVPITSKPVKKFHSTTAAVSRKKKAAIGS